MTPLRVDWAQISGFLDYSVSLTGEVRNDRTGRVLRQMINQNGNPYVGLRRDGDQFNRGVALLVADAFLEPPRQKAFDTPIHLDGDKTNNHVSNLMWRPRWFAIKYDMQFKQIRGYNKPVQDVETGDVYATCWEAALANGLLARQLLLAIVSEERIWPTMQSFRFYEIKHIIPHQRHAL